MSADRGVFKRVIFIFMEQFAVEDLFIKLVAKRRECIHRLYNKSKAQIEEFLKEEKEYASLPLSKYLEEIERRRAESLKELVGSKTEAKTRKAEEMPEKKKRKSMIVYIDEMSFCFGKEELEQISGKEKDVDPEVKNVLNQMNELYKQLKTK